MRQVKSTIQSWFRSEPVQQAIVFNGALCGIKRYDLPVIYHHLREGVDLTLRVEHNNSIAAYFKNFKIGYIPFGDHRTVKAMLERGFSVSCRVSRVVREKYLPTQSLEIQITA